jgi:tripartite-type tricarboxylate transporter receptor subunit TctC
MKLRNLSGKALRLAASFTLIAGVSAPAIAADADADFFKDKRMTMVVPTTAGGLYDLFSRLLAEHLPRHIPGKPTFVVQNMGGAGGLTAANYMANIAAKDGTVIAAAHGSTSTASLFTPNEAKFKSEDLAWIGSITKDPFVAYTWHTSPIKTLDDLKTKEGIFGGNALGSASIDYAIYGRDMFGLKIKIITGYANSTDVKLAMERGELHGTFGNGWSSLKTGEPTWVPEKKVNLLTQFGLEKHPELPNVPLFIDLAQKPEDRQGLELVLARQDISRPYYAPPGTPAGRVTVLRRAFDDMIKDPAFLAAAEKAQAPVDGPAKGEQVAEIVKRLAATPPATIERMKKMIDDFQSGKTR